MGEPRWRVREVRQRFRFHVVLPGSVQRSGKIFGRFAIHSEVVRTGLRPGWLPSAVSVGTGVAVHENI